MAGSVRCRGGFANRLAFIAGHSEWDGSNTSSCLFVAYLQDDQAFFVCVCFVAKATQIPAMVITAAQ